MLKTNRFMYSIASNPDPSPASKVAEPRSEYKAGDSGQWLEVLVDAPAQQGLYTYSVPTELEVRSGDVVSVPFGMQIVGGIAIRSLSSLPDGLVPEQVKDIEDVVAAGFLPPEYWQLITQVADYYLCDLMSAIKVALPSGLLGRSQRRVRLCGDMIPPGAEAFCSPVAKEILRLLQQQKMGDYSANYLRSQVKGASRGIRELTKRNWVESYLEEPKPPQAKLKIAVTLAASKLDSLTKRQTEVVQLLHREGGEMWKTDLINKAKTTSATLDRIASLGYITYSEREILRKEQGIEQERDRPKDLSPDQAAALKVIDSQTGYSKILLHGVTGSGKTEVYLQAIAKVLAKGQSALVLVPEIGLTPQLTDRFRARFGKQVCVYHSKLSAGERYDTWRQTIQGEPQVVIGTRSAVFAPLPNIGAIFLDEEHDGSFKQNRPVPTYHARKVAEFRAQLADCPLVLGSATPSLESYLHCQEADSTNHYLSLPTRIGSRPLPPVEIVDMREELNNGNRSIFSRSLQAAIAQVQERQQQAILFIPRRGHSTFVSCRSCGYVVECPNCDVSLSYHYTHQGAAKLLRCHYCNYATPQPPNCPQCCSPYLKFFGSGTQRVTQELNKLYPDLRLIRFDSDTTRNKNAHRDLIARFTSREADILIGTQMLTKGLDIAGVTLVGVVSADGLLHRSDYRAAERAFATLTQVAGRAGRGDEPGKVIVQTYSPEHPVIRAVKDHDYHSFSHTELQQRQELSYPPFGSLALIRLSSPEPQKVQKTAERIALKCSEILDPSWYILGPAPAAVAKVARRYRWHILLKHPQQAPLPSLAELKDLCDRSVNITLDIDPLNID